ncbi:nuclear transport factor 2 family protein [Pseudomonas sp. X10]
MPDRHALTQVVKAAYAAFATRQPQQLLPLCSQDCCWQAPEFTAFMPWAGEHHGHTGVRAFIAEQDQHLEFLSFVPSSLVVDVTQGQVVALDVARCRIKATGRLYVNHWAHLFSLRDGLISDFREYPDTAAQLSAIHPALHGAVASEEPVHD